MSDFRRCRRIFFIMVITLLLFNLYALRLVQIQLLRSRSLTAMAVEQRTEKFLLGSGRGEIFDRRGRSLTDFYTYRALVALPGLLDGREEEVAAAYPWLPGLEQLLDREAGSARPLVLAGGLGGHFPGSRELPRGIILADVSVRYGPGRLAPHVVGYTDRRGGLGGIEASFDRELRPQTPPSLVALVDGRRRLVEGLGYRFWSDRRSAQPYNVHLTLDRDIQKLVEEVMARRMVRGAVVLMDPWTGDVLAMASLPAFDPADLGAAFRETEKSLSLREGLPFLNRALRSYPPGSAFKLVAAAAYLGSGRKAGDFSYECPGHIQVGGRVIECFQGRAHGRVGLAEAMAQSCNGAFIAMAWEVGGDLFLEYAEALGFGRKTGLPLEGERPGSLPGRGVDRNLLALSGMGQGPVDVTPLQLARAYSAVANGGYLPDVRLVDRISTRTGITIRKYPVQRSGRILEAGTLAVLREILHGVTTTGTGRAARSPLYEAAGKTGTAQTGRRAADGREEQLYWMGGFAPREAPRYTVVVFIEEARESATSASVFREILEGIWNLPPG